VSREHILHRVRTAIGRSAGQPPGPPPPVRIVVPDDANRTQGGQQLDRAATMLLRVEALAGKTYRAPTPEDALEFVGAAIAGKTALASNAPYLAECGITRLPGVRTGIVDLQELRDCSATVNVGITSADFALADTGTLVMLASPSEARLISLLPPAHIAVVPRDRILSGLDELFTLLPKPAEQTSSMVLITGPSRTADIEQILVRGVHGPGEITVVVVG
jgi:L-lactate dehydrogenase complex protein LldG